MARNRALNGPGIRKCASWIDSFVSHTDNLHAPEIFRKWSAITTLSAVAEQKVWLTTSSVIFPNLYTFLIGHPGTGKTRTIRAARGYAKEIPEFHIASLSLTFASLVDALVRAKRMVVRLPVEPLEYNSMFIAPDEIGVFIHKYDNEMAAGLSALYDPDEYSQERRGGDIRIKIKKPQITVLSGSTPSNLMDLMPESAWGQGFTSRVIMVFSDERIVGDDFATVTRAPSSDLVHDLKMIAAQVGEFKVTDDYRNLVNLWRQQGEEPMPTHPKLLHYNARRRVNLYKLSMVSALDKSNTLLLTREDFNRAAGWLHEAEVYMPDIFKAGAKGMDAQAMDEIYHFILIKGGPVAEHLIVNFARERVPAHSVMRVLEIMERSGMIKAVSNDPKTGMRNYTALKAQTEGAG